MFDIFLSNNICVSISLILSILLILRPLGKKIFASLSFIFFSKTNKILSFFSFIRFFNR